jgi:hypothetical protein
MTTVVKDKATVASPARRETELCRRLDLGFGSH